MRHQTYRLYLILDGKSVGVRHWSAIPRIGDDVMLDPRANPPLTARVTEICWGVAVDDEHTSEPTLNIALTRKDQP